MRCHSIASDKKEALVERLLDAKHSSGLSFNQIADGLQMTNAYVAQLFMNQAQLKPATATALKKLVPGIADADLLAMQKIPMRSFDPSIMQEPLIYRLVEMMQHYGMGLKHMINEEFGEGIMSAIDLFVEVKKIKGKLGEDRIVLIMNGKFLPHIEQKKENNTA